MMTYVEHIITMTKLDFKAAMLKSSLIDYSDA